MLPTLPWDKVLLFQIDKEWIFHKQSVSEMNSARYSRQVHGKWDPGLPSRGFYSRECNGSEVREEGSD